MTQAQRMAARAERIRQLNAAGYNYRQIAAQLGASTSAIRKHGQRLGLKPAYAKRLRITREEYVAEKALGWSDDAIGAARGVSRSAIAHKAIKEGWRP